MGIHFNYSPEVLYGNLPYVIALIVGLSFILSGLLVSLYKRQALDWYPKASRHFDKKYLALLDIATSLFPLNILKSSIKSDLSLNLLNGFRLNLLSNIIVLAIAVVSFLLVFLLKDAGQLWYVKVLIAIMSLVLPYYVSTLLLDLYKYHLSKQIPKMIDEFRSAFIKHNKVKPALKECSLYIDKSLGRIIARAADSNFIEASLINLRDKFNNVWFNIFVVLVLNFKENGGELVDQLYKLNKTMTRYTNVEKKKNKRLIWYEMFAVTSSVVSIPAIFWLNSIILGNGSSTVIDAQSNIIISQIIGFSILSLVIIRILRKM